MKSDEILKQYQDGKRDCITFEQMGQILALSEDANMYKESIAFLNNGHLCSKKDAEGFIQILKIKIDYPNGLITNEQLGKIFKLSYEVGMHDESIKFITNYECIGLEEADEYIKKLNQKINA